MVGVDQLSLHVQRKRCFHTGRLIQKRKNKNMKEVYEKKLPIIHEYTDESAIVEDCGINVDVFENKKFIGTIENHKFTESS